MKSRTYYVDSSVVLRRLLRLPGAWKQSRTLVHPVASEIVELECIRAIERFRLARKLDDAQLATIRRELGQLYAAIQVIPLQPTVLNRAKQAFPTPVGSLDAMHLASALLYSESHSVRLVFVTHDKELGKAAAAAGLDVAGV